MAELPQPFRRFQATHSGVVDAYEAFGEACAQAGPLDAKTRERFVMWAVAVLGILVVILALLILLR